jgi:hypothetical protein
LETFFEVDALVRDEAGFPIYEWPEGRMNKVENLVIAARMPVLLLSGNVLERGDSILQGLGQLGCQNCIRLHGSSSEVHHWNKSSRLKEVRLFAQLIDDL